VNPGVPWIMHATSPGAAQWPWLHQVARVWCVPFGHGTHTGEQSVGVAHVEPVAPIFHGRKPATDAQVESTFSLVLSADLASMFMMGAAVHVAAGGGAAPAPLDPQLLSGEPATMQAMSPAAAQTPWLHHDASVCCVPFGHGTQTGAQSVGLVQVSPAALDFQAK
jgi:hypothetical protein